MISSRVAAESMKKGKLLPPRAARSKLGTSQTEGSVERMAGDRVNVQIVNPLRLTLRHYENEIASLLYGIPGVHVVPIQSESGELSRDGNPIIERCRKAVNLVRIPKLAGREPGALTLVTWPILGLAEPLLWARLARREKVALVIHDPTPLRSSIGTGPVAKLLGGMAGKAGGPDIVVHSAMARAEVAKWGWRPPTLLPHPVLQNLSERGQRATARVVVVGQYKPARDVELLASLAEPLRSAGLQPYIAGTGWPGIPGWQVESRRLSEQELDEVIDSAAAVLIPYKTFYQSGIAVRAIERGVPIVGPQHEFLADLYGKNWPGLVSGRETGAWIEGVKAAASQRDQAASAHARYAASARGAWASYVTAR